ncbi:MAG TPA: cytochrome B [Desulfobulbaceae bacterium]|nr:cytochrome B [Desulfobulbaceae bacterium]
MKEKKLFYTRFERFWHWAQALLIILLLITGFTVHGTLSILPFGKAVLLHNQLAWLLIGLTIFAIFWHLTTGQWKQYTPTLEKTAEMVCYYSRDIFKGCEHPVKKDVDRKLNPLQRITYFLLKVVLFPFQLITGLLYMYAGRIGISMDIGTLAFLHTIGAFAFLGFLIVHVYLATTGETVGAHFRAMITGWEEIEIKEGTEST